MSVGRRSIRRLHLSALGALVALSALVVSACGTGPVSISVNSGAVSVCYRALPTARDALNERTAKLHGVHREQYDTLHKRFPTIVMPAGDNDTEVCTFSFTGKFAPGQVTDAPTNEQGNVAVIVISSKKLLLITSWVGTALPKSFGGRPVATA